MAGRTDRPGLNLTRTNPPPSPLIVTLKGAGSEKPDTPLTSLPVVSTALICGQLSPSYCLTVLINVPRLEPTCCFDFLFARV
ncbi:hypothetical protein BS78_01G092900 [Paspalum vaginatum]|nr:hypothetical protein BS78_01G092900 [Paspalum vaginatum]